MNIFQKAFNGIKKAFGSSDGFIWGNNYMASQGRKEDLYNLYQNIGYVNSCINARASEIGKGDFLVEYRFSKDQEWKTREHPIIKLLNNPNERMSQYQLLYTTEMFLNIQGETFWYLQKGENTGTPRAIYILNPVYMTEVVSKSNDLVEQQQLLGWIYKDNKGRSIAIEKNDIIYFSYPNPRNLFRSISPMEAGYTYIKTEEYSSAWTANFIYNNATPSGVLAFKGKFAKEQFKEIVKKYNQDFGGIRNAGKTLMINNAEAEFTKIGISLGEVDLQALKHMTRDDIMFLFRVSKSILGITDDVNRANAEASQYIFMSRVIQPQLDMIADNLQKQLLPQWEYKGEFRLRAKSVVPEDMLTKHTIANQSTCMTLNEKREFVGLEKIEDEAGNDFFQPAGMLPFATNYNVKSVKKITAKEVEKKETKDIKRLSGYTEKQAELNWREMITINDKYEDIFKKKMKEIFNSQKNETISNIMKLSSLQKKDIRKQAQSLMNLSKWVKYMADVFEPYYFGIVKEQGERAGLMLQVKGINKRFDANANNVRRYVTSKVNQFAKEVNATTKDRLIETLIDSVDEGLDITNTAKNVLNVFDEADKVRSETIARTEVMRIAGFGTREAYNQSENVSGYEWFTAEDERTCEFCNALDGHTWDKGESFFDKGDVLVGNDGGSLEFDYEDIEHPPLHCNCRCDLLPVITK